MKRPTPIDEEYTFGDGVIISETDIHGTITYANRRFIEISGYDKTELIGQSHNLLRHPDMPKATFKQMWDTIQNNKEWQGIVKNLRKDGRYYWVDTYIKPVFKDNIKVGYIAARHPAKKMDVEAISQTYAQMLQNEK
ncbi:MAG: aerotaxis receptor Aer [Hydrogenimonas sp.]|nr:MAG: aerotaxis receptor Aer [Hydrogenimonas sp.]